VQQDAVQAQRRQDRETGRRQCKVRLCWVYMWVRVRGGKDMMVRTQVFHHRQRQAPWSLGRLVAARQHGSTAGRCIGAASLGACIAGQGGGEAAAEGGGAGHGRGCDGGCGGCGRGGGGRGCAGRSWAWWERDLLATPCRPVLVSLCPLPCPSPDWL
jgi:hypothetical protein